MYSQALKNLQLIRDSGQMQTIGERQIGLEKECLRVSKGGGISQRSHPTALGSAFTHPNITTDYSEALLEIVTPPFQDIRQTLDYLAETQCFIYSQLEEDEFLWATSMPCVLSGEANIPIGRYGSSNAGLMKSIYRQGLGLRYGKTMQVIAGVHFNFSFPESFWCMYQSIQQDTGNYQQFVDAQYFGLIRNLLRYGWIVPYLFGASPAVCKTFLGNKPCPPNMEAFNETTYYERYGTSLRVGDIGYQNKKEEEHGVRADYSGVQAYTQSLHKALTSPHEAYARLGLLKKGQFQQLNTNLLQIENEYYSSVRPKQIPLDGEMPILSLLRRGVRYVELRSLDVNAYDPLGINEEQVRFIEVLMLYSLCQQSPMITVNEAKSIDFNLNIVAHRGREPGLSLNTVHRGRVGLQEYGVELMDTMMPFASLLDDVHGESMYQSAVLAQKEKFENPDLTPSAKMLDEMHDRDETFFELAFRKSKEHIISCNKNHGCACQEKFHQAAAESLAHQKEIESQTQMPMNEYLDNYFAQLNAEELKQSKV